MTTLHRVENAFSTVDIGSADVAYSNETMIHAGQAASLRIRKMKPYFAMTVPPEGVPPLAIRERDGSLVRSYTPDELLALATGKGTYVRIEIRDGVLTVERCEP